MDHDTVPFDDWRQVIEQLEKCPGLKRKRSQDFIYDLLDRQPPTLNWRQVEWLRELQEEYLSKEGRKHG